MKKFFFTLFISFISVAFGQTKEEICIDPAMDPASGVKKALGIDTDKIDVPHLKYKGFLTPEELRKYDANTIAELFMKRINEGCDKIRGGDEGTTVGEHSEIMMFTDMALWDSIAKTGFQNQHVTATTRGANTREFRYTAETTLLGSVVGYSSKAKDILPKYSGLNVLAKNHFFSPDHANAASAYGNSAVIFNDDVKKRTSFTKQDSLSAGNFRGSPIVSTLNFRDKSDPSKQYKCDPAYCEAQVWGKVGLEDVKYALIPPNENVPQSFIERGIPVYYIKSGTKGTLAWEKGDVAFDPRKPENKNKIKSSDQLEKMPTSCDDCNPVEKRIVEHHQFSNWEFDKLVARYDIESNQDQKREILGEIALRENEKKKSFLLKVYANNITEESPYPYIVTRADPIVSATVLHGLSENPKDPKLKEVVADLLNKQIDDIKKQNEVNKKALEDMKAFEEAHKHEWEESLAKMKKESEKLYRTSGSSVTSKAGATGLVGSTSLEPVAKKGGYFSYATGIGAGYGSIGGAAGGGVVGGAYGGGIMAGAGGGSIYEAYSLPKSVLKDEDDNSFEQTVPPDILMAIALASEFKELKEDPKLQEALRELLKLSNSKHMKKFYNYVNGNDKATICDPLPK